MKLFGNAAENDGTEEFRRQLIEDMEYVTKRLEQIRESYDMTAEPELVESLIYEEKAMQARFDYIIRAAKERNITCRIGIRR